MEEDFYFKNVIRIVANNYSLSIFIKLNYNYNFQYLRQEILLQLIIKDNECIELNITNCLTLIFFSKMNTPFYQVSKCMVLSKSPQI